MARLVGWISRFLTRQRHVWRHKWPVMWWLKHAADIICRQATTESFHSRQTPTSTPTFSCESSPRLPRILRTFSLSHFLYKFITLLKRSPDIWRWHSMSSALCWLIHTGGTVHQTFNTRWPYLPSGFGMCVEQPAVICAWNSLPSSVRNAPSLTTFRRELKTVLFQSSFDND